MNQAGARRRNLFLLLCAACILAVVGFGLMTALRPRIAPLSKNLESENKGAQARVTSPAASAPQPPLQVKRPSGAASSLSKQSAITAVTKAATPREVYFIRNSPEQAPGLLGETAGQLAAAPLDVRDPVMDQVDDASDLTCVRQYINGGKGICVTKDGRSAGPSAGGAQRSLQAWLSSFVGYSAVLFDAHFKRGWSIPVNGLPSRVRVSPSGRLGAVTVFLSGQSYSALRFSTQTLIIDVAAGKVVGDLEKFTVTRNGEPFQSPDFNFWGVTFKHNDNRFYATLWTKGHTYLVDCDLARRTANVIYQGVECPSLSPDETRIAFKKRSDGVGIATTWRITELDLKRLAERPLGETRSVDDQVEWLDDQQILYALPQSDNGVSSDLWVLSDAANATPRLWLKNAASPAVAGGANSGAPTR